MRLLLARAYYHSAQLRKAEAEFRAVTELDPVEDYAWFCRGRTLERLSRHAEAATCFRVAAAMRPQQDYLDAVTRTEARESALASACRLRWRGRQARDRPQPRASPPQGRLQKSLRIRSAAR